ncbi:MAG: PP2C family serine/threonine-protein phosphatase [Chloroflexota bacterium]|nr:PP2C family serine/threonine-protein phosphatase [Chloroflexota bacterium]
MAGHLSIHHHPVFERGVFERHPDLFSRFLHNTPDHLKAGYQKARAALSRYQEQVTWPLVVGPGICAGTHPGADNCFIAAMVATSTFIYNSDCLYLDPGLGVFAVSDAPGASTSSRLLLSKLEQRLHAHPPADIADIVNALNRETSQADSTTLSLLYLPREGTEGRAGSALALAAGDSYIFHGNLSHGRLRSIEGDPAFMGNPHISIEAQRIELERGDFFIIASDGIQSLRRNRDGVSLEQALREHIVPGGLSGFARSVIEGCNAVFEETIYDRAITRFGGSDNCSVLLVYPQELAEPDGAEGIILGGYVSDGLP